MSTKSKTRSIMPGGKAQDKNYGQLCGHIPKRKIKAFKVAIASQETTMAEAIEQAVDLWIEAVENGDDLPKVDPREDRRRKPDSE